MKALASSGAGFATTKKQRQRRRFWLFEPE
jgi:hypothetical protein